MHRSGTSALARMLSLLGAGLPEHILGAAQGNESGHWEPERLINLHDRMLTEAGSRWDDWRRFEPAALGLERLTYYKGEIARLIAEEYGDATLFILKDPRLCRFVPLYEEILDGMGISQRFILQYRNPVSVLDSLAKRDDMSASYASLIWLRHVLDAEEATRGKARVFVSYEESLDDWRAVAARISAALGIEWPRGADEAGQEIEAHLSRGLQYHAATLEDLAADQRVGQAVRDVYGALLALTADDGDAAALETMSRVRTEFESGQATALGLDVDDWRAIASRVFEEMAVRQNHSRRNGEHLQRLVAKHRDEAEKKEAARSDLEARLASLRETVDTQTAEIGQLTSERNDLQARYVAIDAKYVELEERNTALKTELTKSKSWHKTLKDELAKSKRRHQTLKAELATLRNSTSWRLTGPIRAAKRLATDPRGTIAFLRARGSKVQERPAEDSAESSRVGESPTIGGPSPVVETPPAVEATPELAEKKPIPGMERMAPEEAARLRAAFDADFYLKQYPDVGARSDDPFEHYMRFGWEEGRDPSPAFSTGYYLQHAPGLARAGANPFIHWVLYGIREKRQTLPFHRRLELLDHTPRVSAIVPNYNHARFLEQRIDSILAQTYDNIEILILDDCSTDDSRPVIERYCAEYPDRIRALFNDENSGNVFRQWRQGIENSAGEFVWICESDDFCEPDFLESLVKHFKDRSVNVAFGRIQFSDKDCNLQRGLDQYRERAEPGVWDAPLTRPAPRWFAGGFGVNNVIANVGGCVFRRQSLSETLWEEAGSYSILGDWFLYSHLADGGQIAYEPSAVAYFRQHGGNTSVASFVTPGYYEEHERLMLHLRRKWGVPEETVEAFHAKVALQYDRQGLEEKLGPIENYCDKNKLLAERRTRSHILIAFLGFHPGGGEVFPIHLANALRAQGHTISMVAFDMSEVNREMLDALDPAIPVYASAWVEEYGADRFLADAGVSLIHSHIITLERFFFEMCRIETKIPYLVTLHGSYEAAELSDERLMRLVPGVSHFVYTADKNLEPFHSLPLSEGDFTKLRNAMPEDTRPFPKTRRELGIAEEAVVFTLVARGMQRKGWRAAITAFQRLRGDHPERAMHLLLCGDGEETDRHLALHGADPGITFLGYQSRIHGLYRLSDVAVVPTRFAGESFPLIIIQSLQTGTPVIATRIGEIEDMISGPEDEAGILLEYQRDTELFTASLREAMADMLITSERERYARAARERGKTYSMDKVARDYAAIYDELVKGQISIARQQHA